MTPTAKFKTWNHEGFEIEVDEYGSFQTYIDGERFFADTLHAIHEKIDAAKEALIKKKQVKMELDVIAVSVKENWTYDVGGLASGEIIYIKQHGIHRISGDGLFSGPGIVKGKELRDVCVNVPGAVEALGRLQKARKELHQAQLEVKKFSYASGAKRNTPLEKYHEVVTAAVASYKATVDARAKEHAAKDKCGICGKPLDPASDHFSCRPSSKLVGEERVQ